MPRFVLCSYDLGANVGSAYLGVGCQGLFRVLRCSLSSFALDSVALGA